MGELDCWIADGPQVHANLTALVVLCHGFGAGGDDLVPCASEMLASREARLGGVRFVLPAAPIEMDEIGVPGARAWWPIDFGELERAVMTGEVRDLRRQKPELLETRRGQLGRVLESAKHQWGVSDGRIVMGGFSQGAMVATDVALHWSAPLGGLIIWSGTLLDENAWRAAAPRHAGLRVVQSHGVLDPLLPFFVAEMLRDLLESAGLQVKFIPFHGPHMIPLTALEAATELVGEVASQ
jgi:phospholipase/carboxylesterase